MTSSFEKSRCFILPHVSFCPGLPYTIWESDQNTRKDHTQESQDVSPFPAGDHKVARNGQDSISIIKTNERHI